MSQGNTFYDKLTGIQLKCKSQLEASTDASTHPTALAMLANVNQIVQTQQIVAILNVIVQELQSAKSVVTQWRDARGIYYLCAIDGTTVRTYSPSGEAFIPVEPCVPADSIGVVAEAVPGELMSLPPAAISHSRIVGMQRTEVAAGAISVEICVKSGEVSSSGGVGVLTAGDKLKWEYAHGLEGIAFVGASPDTEYSIAIVRSANVIDNAPTPKPTVAAEESPLTGELIPSPQAIHIPSLADLTAAIA